MFINGFFFLTKSMFNEDCKAVLSEIEIDLLKPKTRPRYGIPVHVAIVRNFQQATK